MIGSAPGEGHDDRDSWIATYTEFITQAGLRLEAGSAPRGWEEGSVGFARDEPRFVLPDGSFLPTRLTGVLHCEADQWNVVHLHFSVGVPDEQALQPRLHGDRSRAIRRHRSATISWLFAAVDRPNRPLASAAR